MKSPLHELSVQSLESFSASFKTGALSYGINDSVLQKLAGTDYIRVKSYFLELQSQGFTSIQIAALIEAIITAKINEIKVEDILELVLSGPKVPGIPISDTSAAMHTIIESAQTQLLLVGYAVHNVEILFEHIHEKMLSCPELKVAFCFNIQRSLGDTSVNSEIIRRYYSEFKQKHWSWNPVPDIYFDPRSLEQDNLQRPSLHAKCIIADRSRALVTSANFTEAAQERNIELGVLIRHKPIAETIATYFEALQSKSLLKKC